MSTSLFFTLASNHSGDLDSLISRLPSLNCEKVVGKSAVVILSRFGLSVVSTFRIEWIGFVVSMWSGFHLKLFPSVCSFSKCKWVDCGFDPVCILLQSLIYWWSWEGWFSVGWINYLICCVVWARFSFWGMNLKSLIKISLISCQKKVSPLASSILYHLLGKSARVEGNKCGEALSSLYPSFLHFVSQVLICCSGFWPPVKVWIWACWVNFFPPNRSTKKVEAFVQVCSFV